MKNPRYPLELFQRVITVSLETMKIVRSLPGLAILSQNHNPSCPPLSKGEGRVI